jgi:hypothetical protein
VISERTSQNHAPRKGISVETLLSRVTQYVQARAMGNEAPLRAEVFSLEQLVRHATALAENHQVVKQRGSNRLLARLGENEQILRAYNRATQGVDQTRRVTHAAEWLLDNFYLIEEQIQMARRHLPRGSGGNRLSLDGQALEGNNISLVDDHRDHFVEFQMT